MGWLSNWLQDLIMIVLLATFVDMLLPNRSMERYVKLVLSLLILLTLLSPITKLLKSDPVGELKRAMTAMDAPADGQATLEHILAQGKRMQASEQLQTLKWTAKELANVMKGQIEETTGAKVQSVEVQLAMKKTNSDTQAATSVELPVIQHVEVQLATGKVDSKTDADVAEPVSSSPMTETKDAVGQDENNPSTQSIQIDPIEIKNIQIESSVERSEQSKREQVASNQNTETPVTWSDSKDSNVQQTSGSRSEHAVQIITLLKEKWEVDASQVRVTETKNAEVL
ncbi:stage III sporulation protein AF [Paenibacillus sp. 4624]|uniref:Stage III sporulation protein AF n=1 Tax=Paenibacillus amylolyticus TaxID=1451 RepID=A0A5M9WJD9_PAEAM|nr:stage III sporulation protein AF [Paenibacillus amylolyticus]KAA8782304.1 stage III sporulation protein AF [Paenibacillus amylolyticus]